MEIKNLKKVAERILKAIKNHEKIIIYGDADLDGASSVIILEESIKNLGGEVSAVYFPNREQEGYGINEKALNFLKKYAPALLIALDCGIGNFKEVKLAKKLGFEVIIIDHHEVLDKLPRASIIVDPKQKGDKYDFKELSTTGIIFKLSQILFSSFAKSYGGSAEASGEGGKNNLNDSLKQNFFELTALATIADMMLQEAENKVFIEKGLKSLANSWRPGIRAFFESEFIKSYDNLNQKVSKIISILNVREVENNLPSNYRLLTISSVKDAKIMIERLIEKSVLRKQKINEMLEEVKERIAKKTEIPLVFEGDASWGLTLLSPVASIICHEYQKPTFIYKIEEEKSQGTVRMPKGLNGVEAMKTSAELLETFGGHPPAAGFRIKNENLEKFKERLIKYFEK